MTKAAAPAPEPKTSDRRQWEKTLSLLGSMLKKQEAEIESLVHERHYLENYVQRQHTRWISKNKTLRSQISQMRKTQELEKRVQDARFEVLLGYRDKDISVLKDHTEKSERNMENFRECLEALVQQISDLSADRGGGGGTHEDEIAKLRSEMKNMETAHKNLMSIKDSEITALLTQKDSPQIQSKQSDNDLADLRRSKKSKLDEAHKSLTKLQSTINDLRKSAIEKDELITKLRTDSNLLENDMNDATKKIAKLESDVEEMRACVYEKSETIAKLRRQQQQQSIVPPNSSSSRNIKMKSTKKHPEASPSDNKQGNSQPRSQNPVTEKTHTEEEEASLRTLPRRSSRRQAMAMKGCSNSKESLTVTGSNPLFSPSFTVPKLKANNSNSNTR